LDQTFCFFLTRSLCLLAAAGMPSSHFMELVEPFQQSVLFCLFYAVLTHSMQFPATIILALINQALIY
jgi:hypothetical protein